MAEIPAMPIEINEFLIDTRHLGPEAFGAYCLLLMMAWRSKDCWLPNDDKILARFAKLSPEQWGEVKEEVLEFFKLEGETLHHTHLNSERCYGLARWEADQ